MKELWQCLVCSSFVKREQIDGKCSTCGRATCINCKRVCDKCQKIFCISHIEKKIVMRQQKPYLHNLCIPCREVWQ